MGFLHNMFKPVGNIGKGIGKSLGHAWDSVITNPLENITSGAGNLLSGAGSGISSFGEGVGNIMGSPILWIGGAVLLYMFVSNKK